MILPEILLSGNHQGIFHLQLQVTIVVSDFSALAAVTSGSENNAYGVGNSNAITFGGNNNSMGYAGLQHLVSGSYNLALGDSAGLNYTTSESDNIMLNSQGVIGESNTLRIGQATNTGTQGLTKAFISGITGNTVSNAKFVTINTSTDQLGTGAAVNSVVVQTFTGSGTYTPTTGMLYCTIEVVGGGGGGGRL